ncbi:MAG: magnesium/cobalt transporter CorA [Candidatus Woesearchaeota archaeon]|jgi:magnesium transporter
MIDIHYFDNGAKKGNLKDLDKIRKKHPVWLDITAITKDEAELMRITFDLHPVTVEDLYRSRVRTKVEEFDNYMFCIFHGLTIKKKVVFYEYDFILGKNFIITNHKKEIPYYQELKKDLGRLSLHFRRGCDFLLSNYIHEVVESYFPVIEKIDEEIEELEEIAAHNASSDLVSRIFKLKKLIIAIKKTTFSQRDKISNLSKDEFSLIQDKTTPYFRNVYDHSIRVYDLIDSSRDAIANSYDVYMSSVTNNTNQVMKVLSVLTTIMLPLSVITGLYGTNFTFLPGAHSEYGFWAMSAIMLVTVVVMLIFFRRKGWF